LDTPAAPEPNQLNEPEQNEASAAPETWAQWLSSNAVVLLFVAAGIGFIIWKQLDLLDLFKVAVGLGLVIFIHELGHFLAAKWCDVHVETFSIGFGKPLPGCHFKYGETTYKIGWVPLGGFVKMVGEGDNADAEDAEEDPRSFRNKPAGQRMLIISAGVFMNIVLASICFVIAYSHGVDNNPPVIGSVESGSPAWRAGFHSGVIIDDIDGLKKPVFDDIRPAVTSTSKGGTVTLGYRDSPDASEKTVVIAPAKDAEALYPTIGVGPSYQLTLLTSKRKDLKPVIPGSPAANAQPSFLPGDKVIASSFDPSDYTKVKPLPPDKNGPPGKLDFFEFVRRETDMIGQKMIIRVQRADGEQDITVDPAYHYVVGMRMQMGKVAACRKDSPADNAKVVEPAGEQDGIQAGGSDAEDPKGDRIVGVEVTEKDGSKTLYANGVEPKDDKKKRAVKPLDPLRLPYELEKWASEQKPDNRKVLVTVLRPTGRKEERKSVTLEMAWDDSAKYYREFVSGANSPISIPCLGVAYFVDAAVEAVADNSPAAKAGVRPGDLVEQVRWMSKTNGKIDSDEWQKIKSNQWAIVFSLLQRSDPKEIELKIKRPGGDVELSLTAEKDESWPRVDRGLLFKYDSRLLKADDPIDALGLGLHRTIRLVRVIYQNLYAMVFGQISIKTMSGPLTIADVSYRIAGEDIWQFILFIGMINVNLAVINFLPVPVLDGGHMVFLIYEKIRGKPAPEAVLAIAMYAGFALILTLMCFVLYLDFRRLIF
jgi:regulator of sigma E protease